MACRCHLLPGLHLVFRLCVSASKLPLRDTGHVGLGLTPVTSLELINSLKTLFPNQSHPEILGVRISIYEFGEGHH